jgi:very-short-patch-repair endonuclease
MSSVRFGNRRSNRRSAALGRVTPPAARGLRPATTPRQESNMSADRPNRSARSTLLSERAHAMRQSPTWSEQLLWECALRRRGLGVEFRRQVVIADRYIVDFLAPASKLVVEIDGPYHQRMQNADARRERKLARLGYRVLRLEAELVVHNLPCAVARIREALE